MFNLSKSLKAKSKSASELPPTAFSHTLDAAVRYLEHGGRRFAGEEMLLFFTILELGAVTDPCDRPCGRELSCAALNASFACSALTVMGCDCSGCCADALGPMPPPLNPPSLPPAPAVPSPALPPLAPGGVLVGSTAELRAALMSTSGTPLLVYLLPSAVYTLGGEQLDVNGSDVTIEGFGDGSVIDAEGTSRAISVGGGGRLTLRRLAVTRSFAASLIAPQSHAEQALSITYEDGGTYRVAVSAPHLGTFALRLTFNGSDGSVGQVGSTRTVTVSCPAERVTLPDGLHCGCDRGTFYNTDENSCDACYEVSPRLSSAAGVAEECTVCAVDYFLRDLTAEPSKDDCVPCGTLDGVDCGWNATLRTVTLRHGYWRLSDLALDVWQCDGIDNVSGCVGGASIGTCVDGQGGPLCKVCLHEGEYYDEGDGLCHACPPASSGAARVIGAAVGVALALIALRLLFQYPERIPAAVRPAAYFVLRAVRKLMVLGPQPKLKVRPSRLPAPLAQATALCISARPRRCLWRFIKCSHRSEPPTL